MADEKTQSPTPKKLADARRKGDVWVVRDLATILVTGGGMGLILFGAADVMAACQAMLRAGLNFGHADLWETPSSLPLWHSGRALLWWFGMLAGGTILAAIGAVGLTGALGWRGGQALPQAKRINPAAGMKRMFGPDGWREMGKALVKLLLFGAMGFYAARRLAPVVSGDVAGGAAMLGRQLSALIWPMLAMLAAAAILDAVTTYMARAKRLAMSIQEVRDEAKETEGSPEKRGAIRARQHAVLSRSMRRAVASAQVVVTNPEHFAVALRYRPGQDGAPIVVARGSDALAAAIRREAHKMRVPILPLPPLARAVYYTSRVDHPVDERLYRAVAIILAFVFRLDAAQARRDWRAGLPQGLLRAATPPSELHLDAEGRPVDGPA